MKGGRGVPWSAENSPGAGQRGSPTATICSRRARSSKRSTLRRSSRARASSCVISGSDIASRRERQMKRVLALTMLFVLVATACGAAAPGGGGTDPQVKLTHGEIVLAVLNDQSLVYADLSGKNAVEAVKMAVEDFKA